MTVANYSFTADRDLIESFEELAQRQDADAAELLRNFMLQYVEQHQPDPDYDRWFRAKVEQGMKSAREGNLISNEDVEAEFAMRRAATRAKMLQQ